MRVSLSKEFDVRCPICTNVVAHSQRYDAHFCPLCDVWTEERCLDAGCEFCGRRPDKPGEAKDLDEAPRETDATSTAPSAPTERFVIVSSGVSRNQLCPCGSGKKHKKCCLPAVSGTAQPSRPAGEVARRGDHALSRFGRLFHNVAAQQADVAYPRDDYGVPIIGSHPWRVWWLGFQDQARQRKMRSLAEVLVYFGLTDGLQESEQSKLVARYDEGYSRSIDRSHQINGPAGSARC